MGKPTGKDEMNTTELIAHWTMDGAERGIDRRFRETDDILTILGSHRDEPTVAAPAVLQVRGADEEDWTQLGVGAEGSGGRD
jgi:hypothetical protein